MLGLISDLKKVTTGLSVHSIRYDKESSSSGTKLIIDITPKLISLGDKYNIDVPSLDTEGKKLCLSFDKRGKYIKPELV